MPKFTDQENIDQYNTGHFGYSAAKLEKFGSAEQTLVNIAFDCSSSTTSFQQQMTDAARSIVEGCKTLAPNPDGLSLRITKFSSSIEEVMGWTPVPAIDTNSIDIHGSGLTALHDATVDGIEALVDFGEQLYDKLEADVNGVLIVLTDGYENNSHRGLKEYDDTIVRMKKQEKVESILTLLVRVNASDYQKELDNFASQINADGSIDLTDVTSKGFSKLAGWIVSSSVSQSQALGSGSASQALSF
jgi:hypothetical protein